MSLSRREFVTSVALGASSLALAGRNALGAQRTGRKLLVVLQRGAADGLSLVPPYRDRDLKRMRPDLMVPAPGSASGAALDLDGTFALHPALEPLMRLYRDGSLAVVVAAGSPSATRSHFDAQDFLESGTPDVRSTPDGWLNRYLRVTQEGRPAPLRAMALSGSMPRILQGPAPALAAGGRGKLPTGTRVRSLESAFASMYSESAGSVGEAGREALAAVDELRDSDGMGASSGGAGGNRDARNLVELGRLAHAHDELEVGFVDLGGWDTHVNQGAAEGQLARRIASLGEGLAGLVRELGSSMRETVVVVMTEFGRRVEQNGNGGTDHGHGGVALVLGGPVRGGNVLGKWPGVGREQLHEGRDLAVTTDFRDILIEILRRHLQVPSTDAIFPGYRTGPDRWLGLIRA